MQRLVYVCKIIIRTGIHTLGSYCVQCKINSPIGFTHPLGWKTVLKVKSGRTLYDNTSHIFLNVCYIFNRRRINTCCHIQFESMPCNTVCLFSQSNIIQEQIWYDLSHFITTDYTIFYVIGFIYIRSCTSGVLL